MKMNEDATKLRHDWYCAGQAEISDNASKRA